MSNIKREKEKETNKFGVKRTGRVLSSQMKNYEKKLSIKKGLTRGF
jgi:hypothetical protein